MKPQQKSFDTFGRWMLTRLCADMAPCRETPAPPLHRWLVGLYEDMLANPGAYAIPTEPFETFFARASLTPEESARHEALKAARNRVRKVVFAYLEFLYQLGMAGAPDGGDLLISSAVFHQLAGDAIKKARHRGFLASLERSGLAWSSGDPLRVSNPKFPGMPAALTLLCQACAPIKDFGFYLFRRCDLAALDGKKSPDFVDVLHMVPAPFQAAVAETDERLCQMRFKREIFVDGGDMTYRVRYSKKGDQAVYWLRVQETFEPDLAHYLRWKLETDLTPRLLQALEERSAGMGEHVFAGLKPCAYCYGANCLARVQVAWGGVVKEVCKERTWDQIGHHQEDYERLWKVLAALNETLSSGKN